MVGPAASPNEIHNLSAKDALCMSRDDATEQSTRPPCRSLPLDGAGPRGVVWVMYIRLLAIPLGQRPDWEAAQAELERQIANGSWLDPHTVNRLRGAIENPDAWELQAFPFCGQACYLAFGNDYDLTPGLQIFFETGDDTGIARVAGLKGVVTDMASDIGPDGLFPAGLDYQ